MSRVDVGLKVAYPFFSGISFRPERLVFLSLSLRPYPMSNVLMFSPLHYSQTLRVRPVLPPTTLRLLLRSHHDYYVPSRTFGSPSNPEVGVSFPIVSCTTLLKCFITTSSWLDLWHFFLNPLSLFLSSFPPIKNINRFVHNLCPRTMVVVFVTLSTPPTTLMSVDHPPPVEGCGYRVFRKTR